MLDLFESFYSICHLLLVLALVGGLVPLSGLVLVLVVALLRALRPLVRAACRCDLAARLRVQKQSTFLWFYNCAVVVLLLKYLNFI